MANQLMWVVPFTCFYTNDAGGAIFGVMWMAVFALVAWMESGRRAQAFLWRITHEQYHQ